MKPYYDDGQVQIWHGDCREVLPALGVTPTLTIADPPYGETSLEWDRWPDGWVAAIPGPQLWCFGSMRTFLIHAAEFAGWRFAQDVVWEKPNGSGFATDRFKRVHEAATHWYRGPWAGLPHDTPRVPRPHDLDKSGARRVSRGPHLGAIDSSAYADDGTRLQRSVIKAAPPREGRHPTEKPSGILAPLVAYSSRPGDIVLDPFAGSGSTLIAAKAQGRRAMGVELDERYCEIAAKRCAQGALDFGGVA